MQMQPQGLETTATLRDGTSIALRPVRAEDEPLLKELFAHLSREDVRLRFFAPLRELSPTLIERLSRLDYRRQMALIAQHDETIVGAASYFTEPGTRRAEFAITVRTDWHGRGVGFLLLTRLMDVARQASIAELFGVILRENRPMLAICRDLGFVTVREPDDASVVHVRKVLSSTEDG
jgi:acetyltransferase